MARKIKLWVVGHGSEENKWELIGIYDTKEKAITECKNKHYFIGPITLNETAPKETTEWPQLEYPLNDFTK